MYYDVNSLGDPMKPLFVVRSSVHEFNLKFLDLKGKCD